MHGEFLAFKYLFSKFAVPNLKSLNPYLRTGFQYKIDIKIYVCV